MLVLTVPAVALPGLQFDIRLLALVPLLIVVNKIGGLYDRDEVVVRRTTLDEVPTLFQTAGLFILLVWLARDPLLHGEIPSVAVFKLWIATFVLLVVGRLGARWLAKRLSRPERCLLIGDGSWIGSIAAKLSTPRNNVEVVGSAADVEPLELSALLDRLNVQRVVIAPHSTDAGQTLDLVRVAKAAGVRVSVVPRLFEVVGSAVEFDHVDGLTMLGVRRFGLTRSSVLLKRAFDLAGSTVLLLALAPIFVIAALSIRLESAGPVLFRQTRVGREGRRFQIIKFRTMVADAELRKSELADLNETVGLFKIANDPRVTHVGRVLRKVSLDELPQLLNVWRGEMSLVGPRPLVVDEDAKVVGIDRSRLHLTPGMTGHWQILGPGRVPLQEMVGIDYLYVANWSLWTDVKILLRTIPFVLSRQGI